MTPTYFTEYCPETFVTVYYESGGTRAEFDRKGQNGKFGRSFRAHETKELADYLRAHKDRKPTVTKIDYPLGMVWDDGEDIDGPAADIIAKINADVQAIYGRPLTSELV